MLNKTALEYYMPTQAFIDGQIEALKIHANDMFDMICQRHCPKRNLYFQEYFMTMKEIEDLRIGGMRRWKL